MQVKSIAEYSKGSILQYFRPSLSYHLSWRSLFCLFLSGLLTQGLLYKSQHMRILVEEQSKLGLEFRPFWVPMSYGHQWFYFAYFTAKFRLLPNPKKAWIFPILEIVFPTWGFYWDLFPNSKGTGCIPKRAIKPLVMNFFCILILTWFINPVAL